MKSIKESLVVFKSYHLSNLVMEYKKTGKTNAQIEGDFVSSFSKRKTKATMTIAVVDKAPITALDWGAKITMNQAFVGRVFSIHHPALNKYSYIVKDLVLAEDAHKIQSTLLHAMLHKFAKKQKQ